mgnify:CR=1 FL=1
MRKKSIFCMLLVIAMLSCNFASARASLYLSNYYVYAFEGDTGEIIVEFDVTANQISDKLGAIKITLYRANGLMDRGTTGSVNNGLLIASDIFHYGTYTFENLVPGNYYYAEVTIYVEVNGASDSRVVKTGLVCAPY